MTVIEVWSMVELTVAVVSACLMTMRPLLKHVIPSFVVSAVSRRSRSRSRTGGAANSRRSGLRRIVIKPTDSSTAKASVASPATELDGYPSKAGAGAHGRASHVVSTKISTHQRGGHGNDAYALGGDDVDDEKSGQIRVTQEGPVFTVEPRGGPGGDGSSSTEDLEAGRGDGSPGRGSMNASTRELFPKD